MGSFNSREVTTQTQDFAIPLVRLFVNFTFFGFVLGLFLHEHEISVWDTYFDEHFNFLRYAKGLYFFWYTLTWYIVYAGVYVLVIQGLLHQFLLSLIGYRHEIQCELFLEILFGLWVCGQILGSWLDWEKDTDCLKTRDCKSYFMQSIMNIMESVCEYFAAYEYDSHKQVYFRRRDNMCYDVFHAAPAFLMTTLSTALSYVILTSVGSK